MVRVRVRVRLRSQPSLEPSLDHTRMVQSEEPDAILDRGRGDKRLGLELVPYLGTGLGLQL